MNWVYPSAPSLPHRFSEEPANQLEELWKNRHNLDDLLGGLPIDFEIMIASQ